MLLQRFSPPAYFCRALRNNSKNHTMQDYINKSFFALLVFTLIFGVMFYDMIDRLGFSYVDEICALLIFGLFG